MGGYKLEDGENRDDGEDTGLHDVVSGLYKTSCATERGEQMLKFQ